MTSSRLFDRLFRPSNGRKLPFSLLPSPFSPLSPSPLPPLTLLLPLSLYHDPINPLPQRKEELGPFALREMGYVEEGEDQQETKGPKQKQCIQQGCIKSSVYGVSAPPTPFIPSCPKHVALAVFRAESRV